MQSDSETFVELYFEFVVLAITSLPLSLSSIQNLLKLYILKAAF